MKVEKIFENGEHEYNLRVEKIKDSTWYKLFTTDNGWSMLNELRITIEDYGSGVEVHTKLTRELDYLQAHELNIVLSYIIKTDKNASKVEVRNIIEL